jgi:hypothetical protein
MKFIGKITGMISRVTGITSIAPKLVALLKQLREFRALTERLAHKWIDKIRVMINADMKADLLKWFFEFENITELAADIVEKIPLKRAKNFAMVLRGFIHMDWLKEKLR